MLLAADHVPRGDTGLELSPWRPALDRLATTGDAADDLLSAANRVLDPRADLLAERKERKWHPTPTEPALVIAVDELAEVDADAMALIERLARMGRAEGILIAVTQRPSAAVLGGLDAHTDDRPHRAGLGGAARWRADPRRRSAERWLTSRPAGPDRVTS